MLHLETIITSEVLNYPLWNRCLLLVSAVDFHMLVAWEKASNGLKKWHVCVSTVIIIIHVPGHTCMTCIYSSPQGCL